MAIVVVTEKPSVGRDIARVLHASRKQDGYLYGNGYAVTWALGHLAGLAQPHEIDPKWKKWKQDHLPIIPKDWPLVIFDKTSKQFEIIRKLLCSSKTEQIVCATDAGREGELIFRYIYEKAKCKIPVKRLWISSLTHEAIKNGFGNLRDSSDFDDLAYSAKARSRADWLVGMNFSRSYTLKNNDFYSVGRVQTPTLAMIADRTLEIQKFIPENYLEVIASFAVPAGVYRGVYYEGKNNTHLSEDGKKAEEIISRAYSGTSTIESIKKELKRNRPPLLYDLTELQRHANRLYGFSANKTLQIAQNLYEKYKLISYPRTDSRYITSDVAKTLNSIIDIIKEPYKEYLAPETGEKNIDPRFVSDLKVTDHHAIIPTTIKNTMLVHNSDESKIYDLICRRLLASFHEDYITSVTTIITEIDSGPSNSADKPVRDLYRSSGTMVIQEGWKILDPPLTKKKASTSKLKDQVFPSGLKKGHHPDVKDAQAVKKQTKPPAPYTEATLLTAMETAGRLIDDKEISDIMRDNGLGTPATRASIIETLLEREYIFRKGKTLHATDKGIHLINIVHEHVKSPAMTGQWEYRLRNIERRQDNLERFLKDIADFVSTVVNTVKYVDLPVRVADISGEEKGKEPGINELGTPSDKSSKTAGEQKKVKPYSDSDMQLKDLLQKRFNFNSFRPFQEKICGAVIRGNNALVVMPTGAGKSLCYQLPGIARRGTTLVISPLIALMEDQVTGLKEKGFNAERIHSNRSRDESRQVCIQYLNNQLDFLFIAPERFKVRGFPEMLAKCKPVLVTVDEAHCISHWGHDFRPDYRMLKQYLPLFRPAPVIALTATATPLVQNDIISELGVSGAERFILGFRRNNIAIEIAEFPPAIRPDMTLKILQNSSGLPAIVYTPTRKKAEELAEYLNEYFPAAAYHAGMAGEIREQVQNDFLTDKLEVIVATIAFGMGIDKPNIRTVIHTALPGTVEGYYQEIGRAGRDGKPSRAILMYSWADRHTHEFFFKRDYPDSLILQKVYNSLNQSKKSKEEIFGKVNIKRDVFDVALEKLWIHGGAIIDPEENIWRGNGSWKKAYESQSDYKHRQMSEMIKFAESKECRMLRLVRYFGDQGDHGRVCQICNICRPEQGLAQFTRDADNTEIQYIKEILNSLKKANGQAKGKLFRDNFQPFVSRQAFESLIDALFREKLINIQQTSFLKGTENIEFQRLFLTTKGMHLLSDKGAEKISLQIPVPAVSKGRTKRSSLSRRKRLVSTMLHDDTPLPGEQNRIRGETGKIKVDTSPLVAELKNWRLSTARRKKIPPFCILHDRVLKKIAHTVPVNENELLGISGVGPTILSNYGSEILNICKSFNKKF
ncbi:MAG: DNA topoisomerase 3 [Chitinispirillia bacterium]|jgi:DNA topoisomerase-3